MTTESQTLTQIVALPDVGATIHPFPKAASAPNSVCRDNVALKQAGEMAAHAMSSLLHLAAARPSPQVANALASSTELSLLIDTFLKIRDPDQRRYCLAVVRSCAMQDEPRR